MGAKQFTTERSSDDAALREIVEGVESETGDRFFYSLVKHLASALGCEYAFVSELLVDRLRFRTRAVWGRGSFMENFEVPLDGTPCEAVLNGKSSHHPERICQLFPTDAALKQWGVESYCGVPLLDSGGNRRRPPGDPVGPADVGWAPRTCDHANLCRQSAGRAGTPADRGCASPGERGVGAERGTLSRLVRRGSDSLRA